jgi:hypothetical protein
VAVPIGQLSIGYLQIKLSLVRPVDLTVIAPSYKVTTAGRAVMHHSGRDTFRFLLGTPDMHETAKCGVLRSIKW